MKHLLNCIDLANNEQVQDGIRLCNFKRKIEESPDDVIKDVKRQYSDLFPNVQLKSLTWRKSSRGSIHLFDSDCQQVRLLIHKSNKPQLIPPIGCTKTILYDYNVPWTMRIPNMSADPLKCIFKHLRGWELLELRKVCKLWDRIIVNTHSFWDLRISRNPDKWNNLPPFKMYIKHMFLNVNDEMVLVGFFFRFPDFFIYICGLIFGHQSINPRISEGSIKVNGYELKKDEGKLYFEGSVVDICTFLDGYRQSIL